MRIAAFLYSFLPARINKDTNDFSLPSNNKYKKFIATFTPQTTGTYSIRMYLKYSDGTADEVYNEKPHLSSGKSLEISATPRAEDHPYQVNIFVGDAESDFSR